MTGVAEKHRFRLDASAVNTTPALIAVLLRVAGVPIPLREVMGFVNDDQVIVAPVETVLNPDRWTVRRCGKSVWNSTS